MLKIATWNVNSIKARKDRLLAFLQRHSPDVVCLQELKVETEAFPIAETAALGYGALVHGQKTYNGVAILARSALEDPRIGLGEGDDDQARVISARVHDMRVMSVYVPNGGSTESEKWQYKLAWLERLLRHLERDHAPGEPLLLCGDLNIAPDDSDVARPDEWRETVLCAPQVRAAFRRFLAWGLVDTFRKLNPEGGVYSWWDYRMLGFPKNNGLRIDHVLATEALAQRCEMAVIDREERKGKLPSDHAPVLVGITGD
jgi:exodeoxyribonuclease-3